MTLAESLGLLAAEIVPARSGAPALRYEGRGLTSLYDPVTEAQRAAAACRSERPLLVGLGLGYLAEAFRDRAGGIVVFDGEESRLAGARRPALETHIAPEKVIRAETLEAVAAALKRAARERLEILFDPSLAANPPLLAALRGYAAERAIAGGDDAETLPDAGLSVSAPSSIDPDLVEKALARQGRHTFDDDPPIRQAWVTPPADARRILVIQLSSIGDVLYATPAAAALRERYPRAEITWLVEKEAAEVLRRGPAHRLLVARRSEWIEGGAVARAAIAQLADRLRAGRHDLVVNLHATARAACYATAAAHGEAPVLGLSYDAGGAPVLGGNLFHFLWCTSLAASLSHRRPERLLPPPGEFGPPLGNIADLARRAGLGRCPFGIRFDPEPRAEERAASLLAEAGLADRPYAVLHTGSNDPRRRWRRDRWPPLAERLASRLGLAIVWIGGPADAERNGWIAERTSVPTVDATARGGLAFTRALVARAALLVGPDTSTVHIAAACGTPSLTLAGRVASGWTGAHAARSLVIHGPADPPWCRALDPDTVAEAAAFVLGRGPMPALPVGFASSWTGDSGPNEFLRETHPHAERSAGEAERLVLSFAWLNLLSMINARHGYPDGRVAAEEVAAWLGPLPGETRAAIAGRLDGLEAFAARGPASGGEPRARAAGDFWLRFFQPLGFTDAAAGRGRAVLDDELYLSTRDFIASFRD